MKRIRILCIVTLMLSLLLPMYVMADTVWCTVTFDIDGSIRTRKLESGTLMLRPDFPEKEGYRFTGWVLEDGTPYDFTIPVTSDFTLKATFEPRMAEPIFNEIIVEANRYTTIKRAFNCGMIELNDGKLLLMYDEFYGITDNSPGVIAGKISEDGGRTWGGRFIIEDNIAGMTVQGTGLVRLQSGAIAVFFVKIDDPGHMYQYMICSSDEGKTWGDSRNITPGTDMHVTANDRVVVLSSGRIVIPVAGASTAAPPGESGIFTIYSDDDGETWHDGQLVNMTEGIPCEPVLVELKDGRLMVLIRTTLNYIYKAYSTDGGITWGEPIKTDLPAEFTPAAIRRVPDNPDGQLVLVWNPNPGFRNPLTMAVSRDEGETWENYNDLETSGINHYPAILTYGDTVLFAYATTDLMDGTYPLKLQIWNRSDVTIPEKVTVSYEVEGVIDSALTQLLDYGARIPAPLPAYPVKAGHRFTGWLLNGNPYDFNRPVTRDIKLTASFEPRAAEPLLNEVIVEANAETDTKQATNSAMIELADNELLLVYDEVTPSNVVIVGKISQDGGRSWGEKFVIQENIANINILGSGLARLRSGAIALFFMRNNAGYDLKQYMICSEDEGRTWGTPRDITPSGGHHASSNDRAVILSTGRIILPIAGYNFLVETEKQGVFSIYSDDDGETWTYGSFVNLTEGIPCEPVLVELKDGRLMVLIRTQLRYLYKAYSEDGGATWGEPIKTDIPAAFSPSMIKRIPDNDNGHLVLIWNPHPDARNPLTMAVSRDEGETWENFNDLEAGTLNSNPAIMAYKDEVLISYLHYDAAADKHPLKLQIWKMSDVLGEEEAGYTVNMDANGGTGTMESVTVAPEGTFILPENGFTAPDGKQFKEWAIGSADSDIRLNAGSECIITDDTTIYAIWEEIPETVYTLSIGAETDGGLGKCRTITIGGSNGGNLNGKYLIVQFTEGTGANARVSVVMVSATDNEVTVSCQKAGTTVEVWLAGGMLELTEQDMGTIYAHAKTDN